jgi:hypothetical protein
VGIGRAVFALSEVTLAEMVEEEEEEEDLPPLHLL